MLFDFNGVLVDDEPLHQALFARVLAKRASRSSRTSTSPRFLGLDDRGCFAAALEEAGRPVQRPHLMRLIARKASYYQERIRIDGFQFFPGAVELVREAAGGRAHAGGGDRRPAGGGRGRAAPGRDRTAVQGDRHRRGRRRGQAPPRGLLARSAGAQRPAAAARAALPSRTRCWPSRTVPGGSRRRPAPAW